VGDVQVGTRILLNDNSSNPIFYNSTDDIRLLDLSNMKLIMFIACETAAGGANAPNLPSVAVEQGAKTAIGFQESIDCDDANNWTIDFFDLIESGLSVKAACQQLANSGDYSSTQMTSYVIFGNPYIILN